MKNASAATVAILAASQYVKCELYDLTLTTGQVYRFTNFQTPLTAAIYPSGTAHTYLTGLTITRGDLTQQVGVKGSTMDLTISPQDSSPNAPILIGGYPLLQACRYGFLDGAIVQMSKLFMKLPSLTGGVLDPSPGAVGWFLGTITDVKAGRFSAKLTIDDYLVYMSSQQMPRSIYQAACNHTVYDAGCTLLRSAFTVTGAIVTAGDGAHYTTNLTQADHYFELGGITFTSGVNNGLTASISSFLHSSGTIVTRFPLPATPGVGDTFSIYPGCDLQKATCSGKFSNLAHYMGTDFVPVPETTLDGGTSNPPLQTRGAQAGQIIGSQPTGRQTYGQYRV